MTQIDKIFADINSLKAHDQVVLLLKWFLSFHKTASMEATSREAVEMAPMKFIQAVVCNYFGILVTQIQSKTRDQEIVLARFLIMYFARTLTKYSSTAIGKFCGGRDHATVLYACNKVKKLIQDKKQVKRDIYILSKRLDKLINHE